MRMKINQKDASSASAVEKIDAMRDALDNMYGDVDALCCLAIITESGVQDILFDKRAASGDRPGFYYADDNTRRVLGFSVSQVETRSRNIETAVTNLADDLREVLYILKRHSDETPAPSGLEAAIAAWCVALEARKAVDKGDGSELAHDAPEALFERQALIALASYPCASLDEVRRKAGLFQSNEYLNSVAEDFTFDLLRSFAGEGG